MMTTKAGNEETIKSREQLRKIRKQQSELIDKIDDNDQADPSNATNNKKGWRRNRIRIRFIPIWLRVIIVTILIAGSIAAGAVVGYSIIGDGEMKEVFNKGTWTHIFNLINKE